MAEFVFVIDQHTGGHQELQRARVDLTRGKTGIRLVGFSLVMLGHQLALDSLQRVCDVLMRRRAPRAVVDKNLFIGADHAKDIVVVDDRFRAPQKQISAVVESHMEDRKQIALQDILEIDQQIPAADHIKSAKGGILEDIVLGKDDHLADLMVDRVAVALFCKEAGETADRHILLNTVSVYAAASNRYGIPVQICGKDLDIAAKPQFLHGLRKKDRDGVSLLTCGTPCHPDADLVGRPVAAQQVLDHALFEDLEIIRIAEKARDADQDFLGEQTHFFRIAGHVIHVLPQIPVMRDHDPALDAAQNRRLLVV